MIYLFFLQSLACWLLWMIKRFKSKHFIIWKKIYSQVGESDSGRYSCRPSNTDVAVTMVYVIRGMYYVSQKLGPIYCFNSNFLSDTINFIHFQRERINIIWFFRSQLLKNDIFSVNLLNPFCIFKLKYYFSMQLLSI